VEVTFNVSQQDPSTFARDDGFAGQWLDMAKAAANPDISYPLGWEAEQPLQGAWVVASSEAILAVTIGGNAKLKREGAGLPSYFWRSSCPIGRIFAASAKNAG